MTAASLAPSPTNQYADDPRAAALGRRLFFDKGFSSDGTVSCASCHDPLKGFSDSRPLSLGVRQQAGDRHSMPITTAALQPFLLWDGKADTVWLQPLKALENPKEMDFPRTAVAVRLGEVYRAQYEEIFGITPDIDRIFVNFGKAIEAYERKVLCTDTRFDRWLRGEERFTKQERVGGGIFRDRHCVRCHSGPSFSDGAFHRIGVPSKDDGRSSAVAALLADPLNGAGVYSDDPASGRAKLDLVARTQATAKSFRTASLRGVGQRTFFGHAAHEESLRAFIVDIYEDVDPFGDEDDDLDPLLEGVQVDEDEVDDLVAFLRTLDCPAPAPELLEP